MDCHDNHEVLYCETYSGSGEWRIWLLAPVVERYEKYGVKGYTIPDDEILSFLNQHNIFFATLGSEYVKYIPDVATNIEKLHNLILRQKNLFEEAARGFNSYENLEALTPNNGCFLQDRVAFVLNLEKKQAK